MNFMISLTESPYARFFILISFWAATLSSSFEHLMETSDTILHKVTLNVVRYEIVFLQANIRVARFNKTRNIASDAV